MRCQSFSWRPATNQCGSWHFAIQLAEHTRTYWCNATLVVPPELFRDFAVEILPHGPPIHIWVDFRIGPNEQGSMSAFTTGLSALGHLEIETQNSPEPASELRERFEGLIHYLLENGPVIKNGDTIGEDQNERIKVVYSRSAFGHEGKVMRLDYGPLKKKRWFGAYQWHQSDRSVGPIQRPIYTSGKTVVPRPKAPPPTHRLQYVLPDRRLLSLGIGTTTLCLVECAGHHQTWRTAHDNCKRSNGRHNFSAT